MNELVSAARPVRASSALVFRVAQMVRVQDIAAVAPLPGPVRRLAPRLLRNSWDRGLFAIMMSLGFSVHETVPMRSMTLARPLGRARSRGWDSGVPLNALLVRLVIGARDDHTSVCVSLGTEPSQTVRSRLVSGALRVLRPVLVWGLGLWLTGLERRIAEAR